MEKKSFTTYQVAKICDVYISTVVDWIEAGKLAAYRTPGGHRRILKDDLLAFLKKYNIPIPDELEKPKPKKILIVDDEPETVELIIQTLKQAKRNYELKTAESGEEAKKILLEFKPELVLLELKLPDLDGIELLKKIKEEQPVTEVILITGYPSIKSVIEAMRLGSYDYLIKPFENVDLISIVEQCFEKQQALQEPAKLRGLDALYEVSKAMSSIMDLDNLLNLIMKLACETLEADGGSIMILEGEGDVRELVVKAAAGTFKDVVVGKRLKIGERVAGKAAELCQPILVTGDVEKDKRFEGIKKFEEIKSGMSVPLLVRNKLIGVINLKRVEREEKYTEDDLKLLTIFAQDAAVAIENAKIYQELLKHTEELEKLVQASKELTKNI